MLDGQNGQKNDILVGFSSGFTVHRLPCRVSVNLFDTNMMVLDFHF